MAPTPVSWVAVPAYPALSPYGGFWVRLFAYLIDAIILWVGNVAIIVAIGIVYANAFSTYSDTVAAGIVLWYVCIGVVALAYWIVLPPALGATLGKLVLGYRIVNEQGRRIGFGRSIARYFGSLLSGIVICLGYIWIAADDHKQGWHDKIAGTYVVRKEFIQP
jgi:uncharacterized RDD family membrane protein YckC